MYTITIFHHLSVSKLQSLNSKPCVPFSNLGYFTVCYKDALSLSAGSLQPNEAEKKNMHTYQKSKEWC